MANRWTRVILVACALLQASRQADLATDADTLELLLPEMAESLTPDPEVGIPVPILPKVTNICN
jgi:hypothetical protein